MKLVIFFFMFLCCIQNYPQVLLIKIGDNDNDIFSKCYEGLGCIEIDSKWYDKDLRPINLRPLERHIIKTDFLLMKNNKLEPDSLQYNSINARAGNFNESGFNFKSDLIFLIHDFTSNGYTGWIKHMADVIFKKSMDVNVISVDWQRGSEPPYDQAISNARVVALEVAAFLKSLNAKSKFSMDNVHIIGHGVGAHIAGYVGNAVKGIKKITGLDPDGPRFEGMPDAIKLNPNNAKYVEVLHTDAYNSRSQGTKEKFGHSDFYINNADKQLGCSENKTFSDLIYLKRTELNDGDILPGCSHKRAFKYFIESIQDTDCIFLGLKCDSYDNFLVGKCTSCGDEEGDCRTFGNKVYKPTVPKISYYLNVAEKSPFCMFQFKITIFVKNIDQDYFGYFDFILVDGDAKASEAILATQNNYRSIVGGNNTFVYYAYPPKLGNIKEAKVRWNEKKKIYCFIYCHQYINVEKVVLGALDINKKENKSSRVTLCPSDGNVQIDNGAYKEFQLCSSLEKGPTSKTTITSTTRTSTTRISTTKKPK